MKLLYPVLIILSMVLVGCSSSTLEDAIEKNGYKNVKILFQDETNQVVLFLTEDYTGQPMLSLNTFVEGNFGYKYDSGTGEYSQSFDFTHEFEIINVTSVGNSSFGAIWGAVFNYPNANTVSYSFEDEDGNDIYNSSAKITDTNIIYEKIPQEIYEQIHSFHYKILDEKENVIAEK